jgi:hypothetical protein
MNGGAGPFSSDGDEHRAKVLLTATVINALHRAQFDVSDILRRDNSPKK